MVSYDVSDYKAMLGNIKENTINTAACMSQCTGCKCSCKCSCSSVGYTEFDWEEM